MKKIVALFILIGCSQFVNAQCSRSAKMNGTSLYTAIGTGVITFNPDGSKTLSFASYETNSRGVGIHLYLSQSPVIQTANGSGAIITPNTIDLGIVGPADGNFAGPFKGPLSYTLPADLDINFYSYIHAHCPPFSIPWGTSDLLSEPIGRGCSNLAVSQFTNEELSITPNPANDVLNIQLKQLDAATIKIYTLDGQLVQNTPKINTTNSQIDVSSLNSGLYLLEITSKERTGFRKLVLN